MSNLQRKLSGIPWGTTAVLAPAGGTEGTVVQGLLVEIAFFFLGELSFLTIVEWKVRRLRRKFT
jgi:hypothetical protein